MTSSGTIICTCVAALSLSACREGSEPQNLTAGSPERASSDFLNSTLKYGSVQDAEGNMYATIRVGEQVWMAENLRTASYANGERIPHSNEPTPRSNDADTTGYAHSECNDDTFDRLYGKRYNGYAALDPRGICPTGWHVPSMFDWLILANHLGGEHIAGGKMKSVGLGLWEIPDTASMVNSSGFSALPGCPDCPDCLMGHAAGWWSSTSSPGKKGYENRYTDLIWTFSIYGDRRVLFRDPYGRKGYWLCIRCIQDNDIDISKAYLNPRLTYGSVTDQDGNTYATVQLGGNEWMAEDLRAVSYANGDSILEMRDDQESSYRQGAWRHDSSKNRFTYSYANLYNGFAVTDPRNVCPAGWHVAKESDWQQMERSLIVSKEDLKRIVDGQHEVIHVVGQLRAATFWEEKGFADYIPVYDDVDGQWVDGHRTNESGFSAVPHDETTEASWWSIEDDSLDIFDPSGVYLNKANYRRLTRSGQYQRVHTRFPEEVKAVRCVKDGP